MLGVPEVKGANIRHVRAVREPAVAGQFYPADPESLKATVNDLLMAKPEIPVEGKIDAIVAPHAGYSFSGSTAGAAYRQISNRSYDAVIVLCPSHRDEFEGASVYARGSYRTPLGEVPVDGELAQDLIDREPALHASQVGHRVDPPSPFGGSAIRGEHAIEVQIPFLQESVRNLRIVPIVMASREIDFCRRLGRAIVDASGRKRILTVASSDLYHGYSYQDCVESDASTLAEIQAFNPERFARGIDNRSIQACGSGPIATAMVVARGAGADQAAVVGCTNSGDVTGRKDGYVVGYGSVVFYHGHPDQSRKNNELNAENRGRLLAIAKGAIREAVFGRPSPVLQDIPESLGGSRGVFITLKRQGALRGCIGQVHPVEPLAPTVQQMAVSAALRDPRFTPVTPPELPEIELEISILGPLRTIHDVDDILTGEHGLMIQHPDGQGLLLPQVAAERGWDRKTFLAQTCCKAGLPSDAWMSSDCSIRVFTAEVFGEH